VEPGKLDLQSQIVLYDFVDDFNTGTVPFQYFSKYFGWLTVFVTHTNLQTNFAFDYTLKSLSPQQELKPTNLKPPSHHSSLF
jgi:hypothetical protein